MKRNKYILAHQMCIRFLDNSICCKNPAVMFDIDDTLLLTGEGTKKIPFKPIKPIINLLYECINRNILVLIITARSSIYREHTVKDLAKYKIPYSFLYLRQSPDDNHELFKSNVKQNLYEKYAITTIMSIGDNIIDTIGNFSGYCLKLPNKTDPNLYCSNYGKLEMIR